MRRKIYKMICVAVACMSLTACDSWLDVDPSDQYSTETFWKTKEHASAGIMGCYNALKPWRSLHTMEFDMLTANAMPYNEANGTQAIGKGEHLSTTALIGSLWKNCYVGIGRTNTFIANVGGVDMDESEKAKMVGEAKFLRAFYYLSLVDKFGGVPLIIDAPNADEQAELPRNSKEEVVNQIVRDLEEAAAVLPDTYASSDLGRATKGAALALKARTLLYNSRWAEAAQAAKQVIESGVYQLFNDYRHFFSEDNKYNCEVIFDIEAKLPEYPTDYDQNIWRLNRPAPLKELVDTYLCVDGKTIEESPLYDPTRPYENRDPRLLKSIVCIGYPYLGKTITKEDVATTGFGVKKYTSYEDDVTIPLVERSAFNFILIRYAEVLLSYLEAKLEAGEGITQALLDETINKVRGRASVQMPAITEVNAGKLRPILRNERRVELAMEGIRYWDLLRWGIAHEVLNGDIYGAPFPGSQRVSVKPGGEPDKYGRWWVNSRAFRQEQDYKWPIPQSEQDINPNLR